MSEIEYRKLADKIRHPMTADDFINSNERKERTAMRLTTFESMLSLAVAAPCIWFGANLLLHSRQSDPQALYYSLMAGGLALWMFAIINSRSMMRWVLLAVISALIGYGILAAEFNVIRF